MLLAKLENDDKEARAEALHQVRASIALRWVHLVKMRALLPKGEFEAQLESMRSHMSSLLEIHGQEIPCLEPTERLEGAVAEKSSADSAVSSSPKSSVVSNVLPHVFKFIQFENSSVWSVVQALTFPVDCKL